MVRSVIGPRIQGVDAVANLALEGWIARVVDPRARITAEHIDAARRKKIELLDRVPDAVEVDLFSNQRLAEFRNTLSSLKGGTGAFLAPEAGFVGAWEQALTALPMRDLCTTIRITEGDVYREPTTDDSNNEGSILSENTAATTTQDVAWKQVVHKPLKFHSGRILVPSELEQDASAFAPQLAGMLGTRVARRQNRAFTAGSGTGEPMGFITACVVSGATYTAASSSAVTGDDVQNLIGSVGDAYVNPDTCVFQMHRNILTTLLKLKTGQGEYLLFDGNTFRLNGFPIRLNAHMPSSISSGNCSVAFGDFSKYHAIDFRSVRISRDSETHAESDQVTWGAIQRSSGYLVDAGTKPVACLIH